MSEKTILLTGKDLTIKQVGEIAYENAKVEISKEAMERVLAEKPYDWSGT